MEAERIATELQIIKNFMGQLNPQMKPDTFDDMQDWCLANTQDLIDRLRDEKESGSNET